MTLGRKNYLFAGSDRGGERAAILYSLVETCKLNGVEPFAYLTDVFRRLPTQPAKSIDALLPYNWQPATKTTPKTDHKAATKRWPWPTWFRQTLTD